MPSPLKLPAPTICDMNCFFKPEHAGRHQFEKLADYEKRTVKDKEAVKLVLVRSHNQGYWSEWHHSFEDTVETQEENFSDYKVNGSPSVIIEVEVVRKATVQAQVVTTYE